LLYLFTFVSMFCMYIQYHDNIHYIILNYTQFSLYQL
jgi:hypothetical protein